MCELIGDQKAAIKSVNSVPLMIMMTDMYNDIAMTTSAICMSNCANNHIKLDVGVSYQR